MSRLGIVLVVCLVLLAGCSGFAGDDDGPPDREPYGVDEELNTSIEDEPEEILPGLTTEGLTDADELRSAHEDAVGDRPYSIEVVTEHVIEDEHGTFQQTTEFTAVIDPERGVTHETLDTRAEGNASTEYAQQAGNRTEERWFGEHQIIRSEIEDEGVEYHPPPEDSMTGSDRIEQTTASLLSLQVAEETSTTGTVDSSEGTYYVVEGTENASSDEAAHSRGERELDVRTLVREDGLVRQTVSEDVTVEDDGRTVLAQTAEITDIGETTVERPDWYDDAVEAHPEAFEAGSVEDGDGTGSESANETTGGAADEASDDGESNG